MAKQNLGMVTAYAYAVAGGYTGTEAEFEALLGNIATDLEEIENLTVTATTLPEGSSATASYSDGVLTLGIPKGDTGATGAGATATAGTTTTGEPGTDASVVNSGTTKDSVFDFTIPRGDTGNGIESITLTSTVGAVHTYTITFTDGNTTTFDVTDGEVTNDALTAILADYAKTDGYYESLGSGTADQLSSNIFEEDSEPYNFRTSGGSIDIGDRETDMLVGGTVAWNQLFNYDDITLSVSGLTITKIGNGTYRFNGTRDSTSTGNIGSLFSANHVYYVESNRSQSDIMLSNNATWTTRQRYIFKPSSDFKLNLYVASGTYTDADFKPQLFDLTQMFGSTIADYIYSLEQATAGAGVAFFRKLFPKPYYSYNAGELMSVQAASHNTVGFNAWDEEWELGTINWSTGEPNTATSAFRSKNFIKVVGGSQYFLCAPVGTTSYVRLAYYDADKNFISASTWQLGMANISIPSQCAYMKFAVAQDGYGGTTYKNDICINLSWDGERNGEYEPYVEHSYPLDDSLTLRGIPKIANGKLYYDGDTYESDGTVTRKYGIVDLGTLTWNRNATNQYYAPLPTAGTQYTGNHICTKYVSSARGAYDGNADKAISITGGNVWVRDTAYPSATGTEFKTAMSSVYLAYEFATPTTETANPYTNPQIVDDFGTEEYITTSIVPVGHYTQYMANLKAKLEMSPDSPSGAGDYIVRQTNGENEYVSLASNATIQDIIARLEALEGGGE